MRTVIRKLAYLTPSELRAQHPDRFAKEYSKWAADNPDYGWWDSFYECLKEHPEYYAPAVDKYFKQAQPEDVEGSIGYHGLAEQWKGVVDFTDTPVAEFDIYQRHIKLENMRVNLKKFFEVSGFTWPNPFSMDVLMEDMPTYVELSQARQDPLSAHLSWDWQGAAEVYLDRTIGLPQLEREYSEPVRALADDVALLAEAVQKELIDFIEGFKHSVLAGLEKEYEGLQSEEYFLESEHLEFEVVLEERDEQETTT